jgi:hypothetical protein
MKEAGRTSKPVCFSDAFQSTVFEAKSLLVNSASLKKLLTEKVWPTAYNLLSISVFK